MRWPVTEGFNRVDAQGTHHPLSPPLLSVCEAGNTSCSFVTMKAFKCETHSNVKLKWKFSPVEQVSMKSAEYEVCWKKIALVEFNHSGWGICTCRIICFLWRLHIPAFKRKRGWGSDRWHVKVIWKWWPGSEWRREARTENNIIWTPEESNVEGITKMAFWVSAAVLMAFFICPFSWEREPLRLCKAQRDADQSQHGGSEGADTCPPLWAVPALQARGDGV